MRKSTLERDGKMIELYRSGLSLEKTAEALSMSYSGVKYALERVGEPIRPAHDFDPEQDKALLALYDAGLTQSEIGKSLGIGQSSVAAKLRRLGRPSRRLVIDMDEAVVAAVKAIGPDWPQRVERILRDALLGK